MLSSAFQYSNLCLMTGKHELGTEHDDADESMLWKWEPRDLRLLPKGHAAAGKALKKRLGEVRCCDAAASGFGAPAGTTTRPGIALYAPADRFAESPDT